MDKPQVFKLKPDPYHPSTDGNMWCCLVAEGPDLEDYVSRWVPTWEDAIAIALGRGPSAPATTGKRSYVRVTAMMAALIRLRRDQGRTRREIAAELGVSVGSVSNHMRTKAAA